MTSTNSAYCAPFSAIKRRTALADDCVARTFSTNSPITNRVARAFPVRVSLACCPRASSDVIGVRGAGDELRDMFAELAHPGFPRRHLDLPLRVRSCHERPEEHGQGRHLRPALGPASRVAPCPSPSQFGLTQFEQAEAQLDQRHVATAGCRSCVANKRRPRQDHTAGPSQAAKQDAPASRRNNPASRDRFGHMRAWKPKRCAGPLAALHAVARRAGFTSRNRGKSLPIRAP